MKRCFEMLKVILIIIGKLVLFLDVGVQHEFHEGETPCTKRTPLRFQDENTPNSMKQHAIKQCYASKHIADCVEISPTV